ncbi:hypothetical protein EKL28_13440 [Staphylococcus aureus]|nr:hypothetical protein [Staphylococcus aureus]RTY97251.1 hypothetical protein EKL28_13440 [Staphylococcus aureus]
MLYVVSQNCDKRNILCRKSVTFRLFMPPCKKTDEVLKYLALPDPPFIDGDKFPLCSYGDFRVKLKFLSF